MPPPHTFHDCLLRVLNSSAHDITFCTRVAGSIQKESYNLSGCLWWRSQTYSKLVNTEVLRGCLLTASCCISLRLYKTSQIRPRGLSTSLNQSCSSYFSIHCSFAKFVIKVDSKLLTPSMPSNLVSNSAYCSS